ncbi:MAG: M56 family metallopeptidase [Oscillospiraceae bacterium]|nr:M56 family metallopeptidase [Oscillospiraceae bacterium]
MANVFTLILLSSLFTGLVMMLICASDHKLGTKLSSKRRSLVATLMLPLQPLILAVATALPFASDIFGKATETVSETVTSPSVSTVTDNFVATVTSVTEATASVAQETTVGTTTSIALPDFGTVLTVLAWLWLAGVAVTALYKIVSYLRFTHALKKSLTPFAYEAEIPVYTSPQATSPFLIGFFRSKIILPERPMEMGELDLAIKHELIHHNRHDIQKKFFVEMLKCLNWFNPAFYVFANKLSELSELTVDEILSSDLCHTERKAYGGLLLKFASQKQESVLCTDLSKGAKSLSERLELIMSDEKPRPTKGEKIALGILSAFTLAVIGVSVAFCMNAVPEIEIDSGDSDEIIKIDLSNEHIETYKLDSPVNPLLDADFSGSIVFIHRYGWGGVTDQIIMDDEATAEFVSILENADMDSTPTVDENILLGGWNQEYTVELNTGELVLVSLTRRDSYCIVINDFMYVIDYDSYTNLATFYDEVYLDDAQKFYVSKVEYDYLSGNLTEDEYASEKQNLIDVGVIESEEEYYEILSKLDGELFGFDLETEEEVSDLSSGYLVEPAYTMEDGPENPIMVVDFTGCSMYINRHVYGFEDEPILLDKETTEYLIGLLKEPDLDRLPSVTCFGEDTDFSDSAIYTIVLANGTEYKVGGAHGYSMTVDNVYEGYNCFVINNYCYVVRDDEETYQDWWYTFIDIYQEQWDRDYAVHEVCYNEYYYRVTKEFDEERYKSNITELIEMYGVFESEEEYYEILAGIDDIMKYIKQ